MRFFVLVLIVQAMAACGARGDSSASGPASRPADPILAQGVPQYLFFNKIPGRSGEHGWHQNRPESFTAGSLRQIVERCGTRGDEKLRVGAHFMFSILETRPAVLGESLRRLLAASREADVPVLIGLDGQNWWESRSDLWNWFDPKLAGFNPDNRLNVEWTGWGPEHAVKIGWRNWGRQIRVRPAPNLAAPRFLAEHWKAYDVLIPIIAQWYRELPDDKRYLFGGVKIGWEASIGVNAVYMADGNAIHDRSPGDAAGDPQLKMDHSAGWTFGLPALGYAAVSTAGVRRGGELRREDIDVIVHEYLARLAREARQRGIPASHLFTHQGGTYAPWEKHLSFAGAINDDSIPGWSFYSHDPDAIAPLAAALDAAGRKQWAASEWWRGAPDAAGWRDHLLAALRFRQCRFVAIFNWEAFEKDPAALAAVPQVLAHLRDR